MLGHRSDWDYFAKEAGDLAWGYDSVLRLYHRIEDFHGKPDPQYRGEGGPVYLENAQASLHPFHDAALKAAESTGMVRFDNPNGRMMEGGGGCSTTDRIIHQGSRQSVFRSYALPNLRRDYGSGCEKAVASSTSARLMDPARPFFPQWVEARRFKGIRRNLEILSVS